MKTRKIHSASMDIMRIHLSKAILFLFVLPLIMGLTSGCSSGRLRSPSVPPGNPVACEDAVFDTLPSRSEIPSNPQDIFSFLARDESEFENLKPKFLASQMVTDYYNELYFLSHDLLIVAFHAGSRIDYTIAGLWQNGDTLTVRIDEHIPLNGSITAEGRNLCVFIELEKDILPEETKILVEIQEVYYK